MYGVLIADDEALIREGIADGIDWQSLACCEPLLASNGIEAIDIIGNKKIDIVIADVKMPGINGLELADWVSKKKDWINIIILSGYDDFKYVQSALSSGVVSEYILKPTKLGDLTQAIEKAKNKLEKRNRISPVGLQKGAEIATAAKESLQYLCIGCDKSSGPAERNKDRKLSGMVIEYIKRNFSNNLTLEQVAEKFYISPGHLCRLLRQDTNKTFLETLTEMRIENAKMLIKDQRLKVYEVGSMVGFEDPKYFSQVFKKHTGFTPSEYRKEYGIE